MLNILRILSNNLHLDVLPLKCTLGGPPRSICRFDATPRVDRLAQYDVDDALQMGCEIIEFSTQTTETTAVPVPRSSTPTLLLPLSRMTLCQPDVTIPSADVSNQVDIDQQPQPCSSYSPEPVHGTPKLKFPPRLSLLLTSWMKRFLRLGG